MVVILVEIKLRLLLFKCLDDDDEEVDFCVELICWLKEYELVKQVVEDLDLQLCMECDIFDVLVIFDDSIELVIIQFDVSLQDLVMVFFVVMQCVVVFEYYYIVFEVLSIWERMSKIL